MKHYFYYPFNYLTLFIYLIFFFFFFMFFIFGIPYAFVKLGVPPNIAITLFLFSILGSFINIPITKLESRIPIAPQGNVSFWGINYRIPYTPHSTTLLAINLGGAIIPVFLSLWIFVAMAMHTFYFLIIKSIATIVVVAIISYIFARPVKGMGIALPAFIPPIVAAVTSLLIAPENPVAVAYVSGTLGTLIGADLLHLKDIENLGAPVASIGGAGTFDGIFLAGIIAVLLV